MKRKLFYLAYLVLGASLVGCAWTATNFIPVGKMNDTTIYQYQVKTAMKSVKSNLVKNIAKDKLFFDAMENLGIDATDQEVQAELDMYLEKYGGKEELEGILIDNMQDIESLKKSLRKGILSQKAVTYFTERQTVTESEAQSYYESNQDKFQEGFDAARETIMLELKSQKGSTAYSDYLQNIEESTVIMIY